MRRRPWRWRWNAVARWQCAFGWFFGPDSPPSEVANRRTLVGVRFAGARVLRALSPANDVRPWGRR